MNAQELALMDELLITALPHIRDTHPLLVGTVSHLLALHRPQPPQLKNLRIQEKPCKKIIETSPTLSSLSPLPLARGFILAVGDE